MVNVLGLTFHLYGLIIGVAVLAAYQSSIKLALIRMVPEKTIKRASIFAVTGGILGARIYHVLDYWGRFYSQNIIEVVYIWKGGLGIWGAILGGIIGIGIYYLFWLTNIEKRRLHFIELLDILAIGVPAGQAIGRFGNYFNQEVYGKITTLPWGIYIASDQQIHHPLFIYEGVLNFILFILLWKSKETFKSRGWISGGYLIGYGIIRLLLEPVRPIGSTWTIGNIPVAMVVSVVAVGAGVCLIRFYRKQS